MNNKKVLVIVFALLFHQLPGAFPMPAAFPRRDRGSHGVVARMICGDLSPQSRGNSVSGSDWDDYGTRPGDKWGRYDSRQPEIRRGQECNFNEIALRKQLYHERRRQRDFCIKAQAEIGVLCRYLNEGF